MKTYADKSDNRSAAARVAIAGNIIDYAANHLFDRILL